MQKNEDGRGAAFLNVRGLVREDGEKGEALPKYGYQCSTSALVWLLSVF